jgi:Cu(I)/Ag(I) efflux system membrane protein CusA/SilA
VVPLTLALIAFLLYLNFRRVAEVLVLLATLPLALVGSLWLLWALGYNLSVAVGVGFIALAGVAIETGVIMLVYLDQALADSADTASRDRQALREAVLAGATRRVRPVLMTASATTLGLLPILLGGGTGSEVMSRIAAPMVGGMVSATLLTLLVLPAVFLLWRGWRISNA